MLSRKTKYGIKALTFLARRETNAPVSIAVIATSEHIPQKFLESILLTLKNAKLLESKKGKGGGYSLMRTPQFINISEVYRILEGPIAMVPCVSLNFYKPCDDCPDEKACSVHKLMIQARDKTLEIFDKTTLADLIS
ncbi:RrF2 family transcriptional regulator [Jejudonia soesokkakensis]|uniref:RrF2 family transcriptional regulator n=1 Tax=Jejudonia soesokkakensis TaxID=1323432 RepID=A0ABW2MSG7_9FLAO